MTVSGDVKNSDQMLLIPAGSALTQRLIGMLQSWGISSVDVKTDGDMTQSDAFSSLSKEAVDKLTAEVKATFWKVDDADPVFSELLKVILRRLADRSASR